MKRGVIWGCAALALVPLLVVAVRHHASRAPSGDAPRAAGTPAVVSAMEAPPAARLAGDRAEKPLESLTVRIVGGTLRVEFGAAPEDLPALRFAANGALEGDDLAGSYTFPLAEEGYLTVTSPDGRWTPSAGQVLSRGGLLLLREGKRAVIGNLGVGVDRQGRLSVMDTLDDVKLKGRVFELGSIATEWDERKGEMSLTGALVVAEEWAGRLGEQTWSGRAVGVLALRMKVERIPQASWPGAAATSCAALDAAGQPLPRGAGPDIIVADLQAVQSYGNVGSLHAYAVGTHACNVGTERAHWFADSPEHPVIVQNAYRLRDHSFEQIGMSWVKHGFYAVSWSLCGPCNDPTDGTELGVGCSDPYSAGMNGVQTNMSPRSTIQAFTGQVLHPWPGWEGPPVQSIIERRLQVHADDLDPALNPGARYFVQGHYVAADDAAAGNHFNNASYREVVVAPSAGRYFMVPTGNTHRTQAAVRAWKDVDPTVVEADVPIPGEGLLILASKSLLLGPGQWRYTYALQNLNSDRAARRLAVPLPSYAVVTHATFHDVPYHSGEPYDSTDWSVQIGGAEISWSTDDALTNVNANALRWGNVYTFSFECNAPPAPATATIGLFVPGVPSEVQGNCVGPLSYFADCNENSIEDRCEINCGHPLCEAPCGGATDCNGNFIPDECETDCDGNEVADECDLRDGTHADCNHNSIPDVCDISSGFSLDVPPDGIPDECQEDCNENGIPDNQDIAADPAIDCDRNGVPDECELGGGDCNLNLRLDVCDLELGSSPDCNGTGVPDECELAGNDCNQNGIPDNCDEDCDGNGVPDDCQAYLDCNENGIQDICDVALSTSDDCDLNWVPDECQPDCDDDGVIDPCDENPDTDGDAVWDCYDLCPTTTPPGTCTCPPLVRCCFPSIPTLCVDLSVQQCLNIGWIPNCTPEPCRDGCLLGDADGDGDRDLFDVAALQRCYNGDSDWSGFVPVIGECARVFDFNGDGAVDLADYDVLEPYDSGPR